MGLKARAFRSTTAIQATPSGVRQRGYAGLAMAMLGLMAVSFFVVPAIIGASHTALLQRSDSLKAEHVRSATEHALWRVKEDSSFPAEFSGSPWSASYSLTATDFSADITVESTDYTVPSHETSGILQISPSVIAPSTSTEVTFLLELFNSDDSDGQITGIEVFPKGSISSSFVTGSASGITASDPTTISGGWRWSLWPYVDLEKFGSGKTLQWTLNMTANEGAYWTDVIVYMASGEQIQMPVETTVKVSDLDTLSIESTVSSTLVEADQSTEYEYQIFIENLDPSDEEVTRIRHYASSSLSFVAGSVSGVTTSDPSITTGVGPNSDTTLYEWSFSGFDLEQGIPQTIKFRLSGALPLGEYFTESTFRVSSDGAPSDAFSASTGLTNHVSASRRYLINIKQGNRDSDIEAWIVANEAVVLSVEE